MKRALFSLAVLLAVLIGSLEALERSVSPAGATPVRAASTLATPPAKLPEPGLPEIARIEAAIQAQIGAEKDAVPSFMLFETQVDRILLDESGDWATAEIAPIDPQSGLPVPLEPGLVIAQRSGSDWIIYLPTHPDWTEMLLQVPEELLPGDARSAWLQPQMEAQAEGAPLGPYSGYSLPWAGGQTMYMTQSLAHDLYTPSGNAHFAFDFAKPGYPSGMFDLYAAKGGKVKFAVWTHPNGNPDYGNYLVLEDITTSPVTYQLYLHLAQDSIPENLRVVGAAVQQGEFIGVADDTGISSGNHLHFMVHTNPASYWGTSVDITFQEVSINGGRPRITADLPYCKSTDICDQTQSTYVSANFSDPDFEVPVGMITSPSSASTIQSAVVRLEGQASDTGSGLASAQFMAYFSGGWRTIGPIFTQNSFSYEWDLCTAQVPNGPVSLALDLKDKAQNRSQSGLLHFTKNYACPPAPPACVPTESQVALYAAPDFGGKCVVFNPGSYTTSTAFGDLGQNNAVSIRVGASAQATLFMSGALQTRGETFLANDSSLGDNPVGARTTSSILVQARGTAPNTPALIWPANASSHPQDTSFSLVWDNRGGATQTQAQLLLDNMSLLTTPWQTEPYLHLNSLAPGSYSWMVRPRNGSLEGAWSSPFTFTIPAADLEVSPAQPQTSAPWQDSMETASGWSTSGFWAKSTLQNHTAGGANSYRYGNDTGYNNSLPNSGSLTSPAISIPSQETYYLRFWQRYETEGPEPLWDQRWVQISANGAPFTNLLQLSSDAPNTWTSSPAISLQAYAGQTIRLRFYLATLDNKLNSYQGWFIDDVAINTSPPPDCADSDASFLDATPVVYGQTYQGTICPGGDLDFYKIQAIAGDQVGVRIDAQSIGSALELLPLPAGF